MTPVDDGLLEAAQRDLGYREKDDGYSKFGDWYYTNVDKSDTYFKTAPWCDMFITWAANQAGVEEYVGEFAYTVDHAKWFQAQGAWSEKPEPGAIVFYDWSGSATVGGIDHAGIVERVDRETIFTIEANVDKVWLKRKERDQSKVVGYGLPRKVQENKGESREVVVFDDVPEALAKPAAGPEAVAIRAAARMSADSGYLPVIQEAALPSGLAILLCTVVVVAAKRVRNRQQAPSIPGRHRRGAGRHRDLVA